MTYIPDMSQKTYNDHPDDGLQYRSVGWLGTNFPVQGITPPAIVEALIACKREHQLPDGWRGLHTCDLCGEYNENGEFFVDDCEDARYVLPNMVTHYIEAHGYRLPAEVEAALEFSRRRLRREEK